MTTTDARGRERERERGETIMERGIEPFVHHWNVDTIVRPHPRG